MASLNSDRFRGPITDAAAWCSLHCLQSESLDPSAGLRRKELLRRRAELLDEAQAIAHRALFPREITKTKQWKEANALLAEVWDSLGPYNQKELRSPELKPDIPLDSSSDDAAWIQGVQGVVEKRSRLVLEAGPIERVLSHFEGRILLYWPAENLACGAADVASRGFFDVDNVPPWDIWVGFSGGTLVSWVPPVLIDVVDMGIDANPEQCIQWLDQ